MLAKTAVKEIGSSLRAAGLDVKIADPREGQDFEISIRDDGKNGQLDIRPGGVDVKVFPDADLHQAILYVDEPKRVVTHDVTTFLGVDRKDNKNVKARKTRDAIKGLEMGSRFPISLPEGTKYKVIGDLTTTGEGYNTSTTAKVQATVPASKLTFLVGKDEHAHFVCVLPKRVTTVPDAHAALKPKNVPEGSPRQGEWFFVPATDTQAKKIEKMIADDPESLFACWLGRGYETQSRQRQMVWVAEDPYEWYDEYSSHAAATAVVLNTTKRNNKTTRATRARVNTEHALFVRGYVIDDRRPSDRTSRHAPMYLEGWHRVVPNLEVPMPGAEGSESWD